MKINRSYLKSKMALKGLNDKEMANKLGISAPSFSRRLSGEVAFTATEISVIKTTLCLSDKEVGLIFLH